MSESVMFRSEMSTFLVELQVGEAWVEHARHSTHDAAMADARAMLTDASVRRVRVCEDELKQTRSLLFEEAAVPPMLLRRGMRDTGETAPCGVCGADARVTDDGVTCWLVCAPCGRALPCRR